MVSELWCQIGSPYLTVQYKCGVFCKMLHFCCTVPKKSKTPLFSQIMEPQSLDSLWKRGFLGAVQQENPPKKTKKTQNTTKKHQPTKNKRQRINNKTTNTKHNKAINNTKYNKNHNTKSSDTIVQRQSRYGLRFVLFFGVCLRFFFLCVCVFFWVPLL